jgi:hypothetical protein
LVSEYVIDPDLVIFIIVSTVLVTFISLDYDDLTLFFELSFISNLSLLWQSYSNESISWYGTVRLKSYGVNSRLIEVIRRLK